jgi:hypothetical protein
MDIGSGEEVWKEHLMSLNGCTKNNRAEVNTTINPNSKKQPNQKK